MQSKAPVQLPLCSTIGCGQDSKMQCPTCIQLCLSPAFFCSQECFKGYWPIHKTFHQKDTEEEDKKSQFKYSGPLRPGKISARSQVPENIKCPDYYLTGIPKEELNSKFNNPNNSLIEVKSSEDIVKLREVCLIGRKALDLGHSLVKPGITTDEIDRAVHKFIIENNAYPSPLNYNKFPKSLCTSVNEVICHGIPDDRPLEQGDIVNLDISVYYKGFHSDLNETYHVGQVPDSSQFLVEKAYRCLEMAQNILKPGTMYQDVGQVISKYILEHGLEITRSYTGHGVGKLFHCSPNIPHYGNNQTPGFMKAGHIFTIEPMINAGTWKDILWPDNWTAATADGQRSAQFEHTYLITEGGFEILTARLPESPPLDF